MSNKPKSDKKLTSYQVAMLLSMLPGPNTVYQQFDRVADSLEDRGLIVVDRRKSDWKGELTEEGISLARSIMGQANRLYRQKT